MKHNKRTSLLYVLLIGVLTFSVIALLGFSSKLPSEDIAGIKSVINEWDQYVTNAESFPQEQVGEQLSLVQMNNILSKRQDNLVPTINSLWASSKQKDRLIIALTNALSNRPSMPQLYRVNCNQEKVEIMDVKTSGKNEIEVTAKITHTILTKTPNGLMKIRNIANNKYVLTKDDQNWKLKAWDVISIKKAS